MPDEGDQTRVQVVFDITVPSYQSNALQVRLNWGSYEASANWVGDEYWAASGDLLANTGQTLKVTFYDDNGAIALAEFEKYYRTDTSDAEVYTITADQFESEQLDADGDRLSNLNELKVGTDPFLDEASLLPIQDYFALSSLPRMSVSRNFESHVADERPFVDVLKDRPSEWETTNQTVDIDAQGNGTLSYRYIVGSSYLRFDATRSRTSLAIRWEGERNAYDGDYRHSVSVDNSVIYEDDNTRKYIERIEGSNIGLYHYAWETSTVLIGQKIEGTSLCEPISGTVSTTYRRNPDAMIEHTTISKAVDDPYWRVVNVREDLVQDSMDASMYFVRQFLILRNYGTNYGTYTPVAPGDDFFICDFADFADN